MSLESYKLKIFDAYLADTGSSFEGFVADNNLQGATEDQINEAKIKTVDEAIQIIGKDEFFKNYLSDSDFAEFQKLGN